MRAEHRVKRLGRDLGFDLVRIAEATAMHVERVRFLDWIAHGRQGQMGWITRQHAERSSDPTAVLPGARSVVSVGLAYWSGLRPADTRNAGRLARYAWGRDYHAVMGDRLRELADTLDREFGGSHRWYVDTGPQMDKALAARAGVGWYGKNTNILTERFGSFVLLGEILTTLALRPDHPLERDCGACRLCLTACPTGALGPEYTIDSRKCISYLTIEHRESIPRELRPAMGSWVFGCDICQDVCPPTMRPYLETPAQRRVWTREVRSYVSGALDALDAGPGQEDLQKDSTCSPSPLFDSGRRTSVDLLWLLKLSHREYLEAFRGTSIKRAKVWMLRRNAAVALGNVGTEEAIEPLSCALNTDEHPLVRGHAAWALGALATRLRCRVSPRLRAALQRETEAKVREEIQLTLAELDQDGRLIPGSAGGRG